MIKSESNIRKPRENVKNFIIFSKSSPTQKGIKGQVPQCTCISTKATYMTQPCLGSTPQLSTVKN